MNLTDRVAIVTGSGRGIGRAIALRLAKAGADIVVNDINEASLGDTVAAVEALGRKALAAPADVSSPEAVARMVDAAVENFRRVDILVNNAGVTRDQLVMRMSDADWDTVLAIDLKSAFLCTRAVLRHMLRQRWGRIVSLASVVGITGNAGQANYAAAKAGVIAFTRSVAKEVASRGITANAVAPGYIATAMTGALDEKHTAELMKLVPIGAPGTPEDVAEAVAFLASEEASYITGQVLNIDGGMAI